MKLTVLFLLICSSATAKTQTAVPTSAEAPAPALLAPEVAAALAVKRVPAVYPEKARVNGIQGNVVLSVVISELGDVENATVVSGDPALAEAAVQSIRQWKYKPYTIDGKPTPMQTQITFGFHMKSPPPLAPPGSFHEGKYVNPLFEIIYPLSGEWVRETTLMRQRVASTPEGQGSQVLLAALHVPPKSDGLEADSSLVLMATAPPPEGDLKRYLTDLAVQLRAAKEAKQRGEVVPFNIAGLPGYRADFKPTAGPAQYQAILCVLAKGYMLRWSILADSGAALEEAVATVGTISKYEPGPAKPEVAEPPAAATPAAGSAEETPNRVQVSSGVTAGFLIKKVEPIYPPAAKSGHIQGDVVLRAVIDKSGNIIDLEAISGPIELVPTSVNAVRQWKYRPYLLLGKPIELVTTVEVHYRLG